jgi:hypothetical protein
MGVEIQKLGRAEIGLISLHPNQHDRLRIGALRGGT